MHHWQLTDDCTLALLGYLSHHFPTDHTHRLDLSYSPILFFLTVSKTTLLTTLIPQPWRVME
jgi:hypothetical protein